MAEGVECRLGDLHKLLHIDPALVAVQPVADLAPVALLANDLETFTEQQLRHHLTLVRGLLPARDDTEVADSEFGHAGQLSVNNGQ